MPVNLKAPWLVPMAQASESQPVSSTNSLGLVRVGQLGVGLVDLDVLLHAAQLAELGLDHQALGVGRLDHALRDLDVLLERLVGGVDHHRAVEPGSDAIHAGGLVAVVEVDGEDRLRKDLVRGPEDGLEHALVGVGPGALADLDDERRLAIHVAAEQAHGLFQIIDIVGSDGILSVRRRKQLFGCYDHRFTPFSVGRTAEESSGEKFFLGRAAGMSVPPPVGPAPSS